MGLREIWDVMRYTHHSRRYFFSTEKEDVVGEGGDTRRKSGRQQKQGQSSREARQLVDHPLGRVLNLGYLITQ